MGEFSAVMSVNGAVVDVTSDVKAMAKKPRRSREQQEQDKISKALAKLEDLRDTAICSRLEKARAFVIEANCLYAQARDGRSHQTLTMVLDALDAFINGAR